MPADELLDNPRLAAQMRPALVGFFRRRTGSSVEAEDLAQDVLVRALRHADWKTTDQAKGYIFRAAVNRWRDRHRRRRTRGLCVTWSEQHEEQLGLQQSPERHLIVSEELSHIAQLLDGMQVRTRAVVLLIKVEKEKAATVADMLGISVSAVNKHLASGIARLTALRRQLDSA